MWLLALIISIIFLVYVAIYEGMVLTMKDAIQSGDPDKAKKWDKVRHGWSTILRFASVPISMPYLYYVWPEWWKYLWVLFLFIFLAWCFWNICLNLHRGLKWWYKGSSGTSSWLDKLFGNIYVYWGLQFLALIISVICYIIFN